MDIKSTIKELVDEDQLVKFIHGCHILHYHGIVDAFGHLSLRVSDSVFLMSRYLAPALVSSVDDLVLYQVENGEAVHKEAPRGFSERFIHSEIYKRYPGVVSVVHSHSLDVVPFSISSTPLQACFHMAGFLGTGVPIWDAATVYQNSPEFNQDMLVKNVKLGSSLALALGTDVRGDGIPQHPVVLMRGHGFVATADSIEMAISKCIYTAQNARIQMSATGLGGSVKPFNEREAHDAGSTTIKGAVKPWPLWIAEVENSSLYTNKI